MESHKSLAEFSMSRFHEHIIALAQNPTNYDIDTWVEFLHECLNLFKKLGSAMSMAFSDIQTKADVIRNNKNHFNEKGEPIKTI